MFCLKFFNRIHIYLFTFLLFGCVGIKNTIIKRDIESELNKSSVFSTHLTGFCLYDPESKQYLARFNDNLYFQPASNVKILTTYACISTLNDSIATFDYAEYGDTIIIRPLGDPTFLHPLFREKQYAFDFLKNKIVRVNFPEPVFKQYGSGWAWDDFHLNFQQELSWFPMYGNSIWIEKDSVSRFIPGFFRDYTDFSPSGNTFFGRERNYNAFRFTIPGDSIYRKSIPYIVSNELTLELLSDTLNTRVTEISYFPMVNQRIQAAPIEPVLELMMKSSDNFLAEQLLIYSSRYNEYASVDKFRNELIRRWRGTVPDELVWVDGSGLSRYNLITPRSFVSVLSEIYSIKGMDYIQRIFPAGGVSGTIKNNYKSPTGIPYVYAKTGTFRNNHNLSGYIITKSGKTLIFSLMNNNFIIPVDDVKREMEKFLFSIYDAY